MRLDRATGSPRKIDVIGSAAPIADEPGDQGQPQSQLSRAATYGGSLTVVVVR